MSIILKTPEEFQKMRAAGKLAAQVLEMIKPYVKAGVTTNELNDRCHDYIVNELDAIPAPLNYKGFPKSICTSVNHVVCHGIPNDKPLKNGDIVNVDVTVIKDDYHGDTSNMFAVGTIAPFAQKLMDVTQACLYQAIQSIKPGVTTLGDIGATIQALAEQNRYSVVREYCGHGIGRVFHEDPHVLHYGKAGVGEIIQPGMTFTIEPMINLGQRHVKILGDGWTVITRDHKLSAQYEHTIGITENGVEVFTKRSDEHF